MKKCIKICKILFKTENYCLKTQIKHSEAARMSMLHQISGTPCMTGLSAVL